VGASGQQDRRGGTAKVAQADDREAGSLGCVGERAGKRFRVKGSAVLVVTTRPESVQAAPQTWRSADWRARCAWSTSTTSAASASERRPWLSWAR